MELLTNRSSSLTLRDRALYLPGWATQRRMIDKEKKVSIKHSKTFAGFHEQGIFLYV